MVLRFAFSCSSLFRELSAGPHSSLYLSPRDLERQGRVVTLGLKTAEFGRWDLGQRFGGSGFQG